MASKTSPEEKKLDSSISSSESTRRRRTRFKREQINILVDHFEKNPYPGIEEREELSRKTNIPESRIQVWFQNRRARHNKQSKKRAYEASTSSRKRICLESVSPNSFLEKNFFKQESATSNSGSGEPCQEAGPGKNHSFEKKNRASNEAAYLYAYNISQRPSLFFSQTMKTSNKFQPCDLPGSVPQGNSSQWTSSWTPQKTQGSENYGSYTFSCGGVKPPLNQQQQRWAMDQLYPGYNQVPFQYAQEPPYQLQQLKLQQHPTFQGQQLTPHHHQSLQELQGQTKLPPVEREKELPNKLLPFLEQQELCPTDLSKRTVGLESPLFLPNEHEAAPLENLTALLGDLTEPQGHLTDPQGGLAAPQGHLTDPLGDLTETSDAQSVNLMFLDALSFVLNDQL